MTFMEDIAFCIIGDSIKEENINKIIKLISNGTNCMSDLIESLSKQLTSTLAEERKKGIDILRLVFKGLILKDTLSSDYIKLLSCFIVNYLSDWACIEGVLDILTCIIKTKGEVLKCTYLNILEDDKLFEEYSFNPIVSINTGIKGKVMNDGNSIKLCTKICTFHKFSNQYGIDNVDKQEDLYKMTLFFYIFTQILYIVPTRQLVYTSRISVLNILIMIFENEEYITNIRRMGPAAIPAIIQHVQGEKDPRVLILSFCLIKNLLLKFEDIIKIYDNIEVNKDKSVILDNYSKYDYYKGLIPEIIFDNKNLEDCEHLEINKIKNNSYLDLIDEEDFVNIKNNNNSSNILSTLISDVLLSYFPLNFRPPANDIHKISPETLKRLLFEAITSTDLLQDAIIKTIIELMDTQNLVEDNIDIINKFDENLIYEEFYFDNNYELDELENKKNSKLLPVILDIADEEILQDIKDILTLYGVNLIPKIITKHMNGLFLFIQQLLKRTVVCNNNICSLLFYIIGTFFKYQSLDKDGDFILRNGIHKYIILDMINKLQNLNISTELDPFFLNLINSCNLYYNMFILICIENEFLDYLIQNIMNNVYIGKSKTVILRIISSLLYTHLINIYQSDNNILLEINKNPIFVKLCEFCKLSYLNESDNYILLIYCLCSLIIEYNNEIKYLSNNNTNNIMWFYDELKKKWDNIDNLSKDDQSFIHAITCILFIQNEDISRNFWLEYIKNKSIQFNYHLIILKFMIYSFYKSQNPPVSIIKSISNNIEDIILCNISESNSNEQMKYCLMFLKMIWNILNIYKCKNIILNISINIDNWFEHIFYHIFPILINNKLIEKYQFDMNNSCKDIKSINLNEDFDYRKYIWIIGNLISSLKFINLSNSNLIIKIIDYINNFKNILKDNELFFIYRIFVFILLNGITDNNNLINLLDKNIKVEYSIINILENCQNWLNDLENINNEKEDFKYIYKNELEHLIINLIHFYLKYHNNDINKIQVIFQYKWNSKIIGISIRLIELNAYINKQNIKNEYEDEKNSQFNYILSYTDQICKLAPSNNINELYLVSSCLLYIIGANLPIIIEQDSKKNYIQIGNYYLNFNNINNENYIRKFQNICDIFIYYKNLGDCIIEDIQLNFYNFMEKLDHIYDNINNLIIPTSNDYKYTIMDRIKILNNEKIDNNLENKWPLNINLTDLYSQINIDQTIIKSFYIKISDIIIPKIIQTILYNHYKVNLLILIPIMAIFNNVSISLIVKYNNENILRYIFMLSLFECSGLNKNNHLNENSKLKILLMDYTSKKFENYLDNNFDIDEIIKLLDWQENKNCFSDIKFKEFSDYFIYNLQTLSTLIRFIYFVHKKNISFNSNINKDYSDNLDFIFNDLFIYGLLASHIIIYHPLPLVRLFSYLLIKQIFKFPGIFRIGIKDKILSALFYLINNEKNKFLRDSASILHCQLIIMEDS